MTEEYVDMVEAGILDPAKVTRSALQNATSVASTLPDNRVLCSEHQKKILKQCQQAAEQAWNDVE